MCAFSQEDGGKSKSIGKTREKKNSPMDSRFRHERVQRSFAATNSCGAGCSEWWTSSECGTTFLSHTEGNR